jgi:hypothetical protein
MPGRALDCYSLCDFAHFTVPPHRLKVQGETGELSMRNTFKNQTPDRWAMVSIALLLIATTVGAIAANSRTRAVTPQLWKQTPNFMLSLPGGYGVDEVLY